MAEVLDAVDVKEETKEKVETKPTVATGIADSAGTGKEAVKDPKLDRQARARANREKEAAQYKKYLERIDEMEQSVKFLAHVFEYGSEKNERYGKVTIEDPSLVSRIAVSLYSTTSIMCGNVRAKSSEYELKKRLYEASLYNALKQQYQDSGRRYTQKDLEAEVMIKNKEPMFEDLKWDMLLSRCLACKDAFGEQLRTLNMLQQMRATELRNWG